MAVIKHSVLVSKMYGKHGGSFFSQHGACSRISCMPSRRRKPTPKLLQARFQMGYSSQVAAYNGYPYNTQWRGSAFDYQPFNRGL
jgi:hypothetical protein